ncbi:MAG: hypothetical protein KDK36_20395, partial [Leptospiraceae bacterium]|nr:hypothetical protein [Leptospiraceae bacterium]
KKSVTEDPIIKSIIEKLKVDQPGFENNWKGLKPNQKVQLLKDDFNFREKITIHDRKILDRILSNQFKTNIFVYLMCSVLLVTGIYFFIKSKPLKITNIQAQNVISRNGDDIIITDLDPITITWTSSGEDGEVFVVLENIDTGKQTQRKRGLASDGKIIFNNSKYSNYDNILSNRFPNESNRIRAIIYSSNESFNSKEFEVKVGVTIICYEEKPNKIIFNAIIDQYIIENFHFAPKISLYKDEKFKDANIFEASEYSSKPEIIISNPKNYTTVNFIVYINPRDSINKDLYRFDIELFRDALKALKK